MSWAGVIYVITNTVNGKQYIGKTTYLEETDRWSGHLYSARRGSRSPIHCAVRKYGEKTFTVRRLQYCRTLQSMNAAEKKWIEALRTKVPLGYNLTDGGDGFVGTRHRASSKKKISASLLAYYDDDKTAGARLSTKLRNHYAKPGSRQKLSEAHRTPEAKRNMSRGQRRRFSDVGERQKQSEHFKNWFADPENHERWLRINRRVCQSQSRRNNCSASACARMSDPKKCAEYLVARYPWRYGADQMSFNKVLCVAKKQIAARAQGYAGRASGGDRETPFLAGGTPPVGRAARVAAPPSIARRESKWL